MLVGKLPSEREKEKKETFKARVPKLFELETQKIFGFPRTKTHKIHHELPFIFISQE